LFFVFHFLSSTEVTKSLTLQKICRLFDGVIGCKDKAGHQGGRNAGTCDCLYFKISVI